MGFPILDQNELLFAQPIRPTALNGLALHLSEDSTILRERLEALDRNIDDAASTVQDVVGSMRQAQYRLSLSFNASIGSIDFRQLLDVRNDLLDHIDTVENFVAETEKDAESLHETHESLMNLLSEEHHLQAKHRRQFRKFAATDRKLQGQRQVYISFLRTQLLPKLDARLHEIKPTGRSFGDAVNDLIDRYPVIAEYLAR